MKLTEEQKKNFYKLFTKELLNYDGNVQLFADTILQYFESVPAETLVSGILADFKNLLIDVMSSRKCSIGSLGNYYDLHLEVERINKLYSKIQEYHTNSQNSR